MILLTPFLYEWLKVMLTWNLLCFLQKKRREKIETRLKMCIILLLYQSLSHQLNPYLIAPSIIEPIEIDNLFLSMQSLSIRYDPKYVTNKYQESFELDNTHEAWSMWITSQIHNTKKLCYPVSLFIARPLHYYVYFHLKLLYLKIAVVLILWQSLT